MTMMMMRNKAICRFISPGSLLFQERWKWTSGWMRWNLAELRSTLSLLEPPETVMIMIFFSNFTDDQNADHMTPARWAQGDCQLERGEKSPKLPLTSETEKCTDSYYFKSISLGSRKFYYSKQTFPKNTADKSPLL